jgi:nicotinate dehydrogenase subunit B
MKPNTPFKLDGAQPLPEKAVDALDRLDSSRRDFLKAAGVMTVGFAVAGTAGAQSPINPTGLVDATQVDHWLAIGADESITVFVGKHENGNGIRTVQLQLAAEELSVPLDRITLITGISGVTPDQFLTVGSLSTMTQFGTAGLRVALDTARDALYQLASLWLDAPAAQLVLTNGVFSVSGGDPTYTVSYGQLVQGQRFNIPVNPKAVPNAPSTWKVLGTSVPRSEIPAKIKGTFQYVHKVRVPGMLHGKVVRPPALGAHLGNRNTGIINGMPGNPQVVIVNDFVGVVADTEWHALNAAKALAPGLTWSAGDTVVPAQADLYTFMTQQPSSDALQVDSGDVDTVMARAAHTITAQYRYPFQMHGSLGSSCAVADVRGGTGKTATAKIWGATQGVYATTRSVLATLLGIPAPNIQVTFVEGSGCYGHNGADAVAYDAALLSQAVGKPVRLQYTRSDEMIAGEHFGHATVANEKVGVDANGNIIAWDYTAIRAQRGEGAIFGTPGNGIPGALAGFPTTKLVPTTTPNKPTASSVLNGSNHIPPYVTSSFNGVSFGTGTVTSQRVLTKVVLSPFWTAWLRSPDRLQNTFAHESVMDEVAASLNADPVLYRLRHLTDPRLINALNAVAQKAWDTRPSPKAGNARTGVVTGRGVANALYEGNNGYVAMVAEVSVDQDKGTITVTKVTTSIDTGPVINPDGLRNQMEGQVIQGISRALVEEVKFDPALRNITSNDWDSYPVVKFGDALPEIDAILIDNRKVSPTGAGETTITVIVAAIANAIFDASGVRMRQVPFTSENFLAAKAAQKV